MCEKNGKENCRDEQRSSRKNVLVLFGGCSPEYPVSLASASAVLRAIDRERYAVFAVGITRAGDWLWVPEKAGRQGAGGVGGVGTDGGEERADAPGFGLADGIEQDIWEQSGALPAVLSQNRTAPELLLFRERDGAPERVRIDLALPILHGKCGEDGTVQGLLELAGIPIAGCGTLASALCMDKDRAHRIASLAGLRVPRGTVLRGRNAGSGKETGCGSGEHAARATEAEEAGSEERISAGLLREAQSAADALGYPIFVKPVGAGSSFGISRIQAPEELPGALAAALQYDDYVILEEEIRGFEVGCAVMGWEELIAGEPDEIELSEGFFDFHEKYHLTTSRIHVPARLPGEKREEIREAAKRIYRALGCGGFARVDFFLTPEGEIVFNEVNTIPGFTEHSRFPGMMRAAGISFEDVVAYLLGAARGRGGMGGRG